MNIVRNMGSLGLYIERINAYLGASTFGRVFRLQGCGHVRLPFAL